MSDWRHTQEPCHTTPVFRETTQERVERMASDGRITVDDADAIRTFASFLESAPSHEERKTPEGQKRFLEVWAEHYPEDYAKAVAESKSRTAPTRRTHAMNSTPKAGWDCYGDCGRSIADGITLHRTRPKGQPGDFMCEDCIRDRREAEGHTR